MGTPIYQLEIAALKSRLAQMEASRNFWRWGAIVLATALVIALATANQAGYL